MKHELVLIIITITSCISELQTVVYNVHTAVVLLLTCKKPCIVKPRIVSSTAPPC